MTIDEFEKLIAEAVKKKQLREVYYLIDVNNAQSLVKIFSTGYVSIDENLFLKTIDNGKIKMQISCFNGNRLLSPTKSQFDLIDKLIGVLRNNKNIVTIKYKNE